MFNNRASNSYSEKPSIRTVGVLDEIEPGRVQLKCDGTRWRMGREEKCKLVNGVGSQCPSHYLGTWCIQHYYRWCAHLGCQYSTEVTLPADLNGLVRFAERRNLGFCAYAITFQTQSTTRKVPSVITWTNVLHFWCIVWSALRRDRLEKAIMYLSG